MLQTPFYNPEVSYEENYEKGPYGVFADGKKYHQKGEPQYEFAGQKIYLPFGIPAGPLINGKFVKAALDKGFDIVVYKTVRSKKYPAHLWPNVLGLKLKGNLTEKKADRGLVGYSNYHEPLSITNSFGVPSFDPDVWQEDLASCVRYAKKGQVVVGSFQGTLPPDHHIATYIKDFVLTAKLMKETKVKVIEINLSCPNEGHANFLCFDVERTRRIIVKIKEAIGDVPLILKLAYFHDDTRLLKFVTTLCGLVEGFAAINTLPAKILDVHGRQALPGEGRLKSGVCGKAIQWAGLDMVRRLKKIREQLGLKYTIEGVGGITTVPDYKKYRKAGADSVMSATGAMWNPYLSQEIKKKYL